MPYTVIVGDVNVPGSAASKAAMAVLRVRGSTVISKSYAEALRYFVERYENDVSLVIIDAGGPQNAVLTLKKLRERWSQAKIPAVVMMPGTWDPGEDAVIGDPSSRSFETLVNDFTNRWSSTNRAQ